MEHEFWHEKWENNHIGFHENKANALLVKHLNALALSPSNRFFLPLCGKTLDIGYLLNKGLQVVGCELNEIAVNDLFKELQIKPSVTDLGTVDHYQAKNIDIFLGDIFELTADQLGHIDAIYDRAALVALPLETRQQYSQQLINLTKTAKQLVIAFEYDQTLLPGPPFRVDDEEIHQLYAKTYKLNCLEKSIVEGGLKKKVEATENVWLLEPLA